MTTPEAKPAPAPQIGLIHAFGTCVECICILVRRGESDVPDGEGIVLKLRRFDGSSRVAVAYWLGLGARITGWGGGSRSKDMPQAQRTAEVV